MSQRRKDPSEAQPMFPEGSLKNWIDPADAAAGADSTTAAAMRTPQSRLIPTMGGAGRFG
jgi:hypothetical protein